MDDELTRSDLRDLRGALRQDWPIPPEVRKKVLQRLIDYLDRDHEDGATAPDRTVLMAARTLAAFADLSLKQATLDLRREKQEGKTTDKPLAALVQEAERRAEERRLEREREDDGGGTPDRVRDHRGPD